MKENKQVKKKKYWTDNKLKSNQCLLFKTSLKKKNPRNSGSFKPKYKDMGMIQDFSTVL